MTRSHSLRPMLRIAARTAAAAVLFAALASLPAHAVNKDMIQLQTQVQQLQDAVARLQQSNDERMGVLKDLVQQTADSINKMSVSVDGLKLGMQNLQSAATTSNQQLSGQVQSLNDSLDELKARLDRMEKSLGNIQSQQQTANAVLTNLPQAGIPAGNPAGNPTAAPTAPAEPSNAPPPGTDTTGTPTPNTSAAEPIPAPAAVPAKPAAGDLYRGAFSDYIAARYPLATSEFTDLIKAYPDDNLSGNAYFYLGEMAMRAHKPSVAIKNYDEVITHYPDNAKIPPAELHKAYALIDAKEIAAGERQLRTLIQRFPVSPEASQARAKLSALHSHE